MANHPNVVFNIKTEDGTIRIPEKGGLNIRNKIYGIMPFNYNMDGVVLQYATAHPCAILDNKSKVYCYYAMDGIAPEFKFENKNIKAFKTTGRQIQSGNYTLVQNLTPGENCIIDVTTNTGNTFRILLLSKNQARYSYVFDIKGVQTMLLTSNMAYYDEVKDSLTIRSTGDANFTFDAYPAIKPKNNDIKASGTAGIFAHYQVSLPQWAPVNVAFKQLSNNRDFKKYCDSLDGKTPLGPTYQINYNPGLPYKAYSIAMPPVIPPHVQDVLLEFDYKGNTAQLYAGGTIIADDYYAGTTMPYSLRRRQDLLGKKPFVLQITPLLQAYQIHFEPGTDVAFAKDIHAELKAIKLKPVYQVVF